MFETPVLFLIFNRPDLTAAVFDKIRQAKPAKLFIAADGPRDQIKKEEDLCKETRELVLNNIDWPCEVEILFREKNLGCSKAVIEAITWFFNNVEYGIILEDDCLPLESFFLFCEELLIKYKEDERIMAISGTNFFGDYEVSASYLFSIIGGSWGWASWRRAWSKFDYSMKDWGKREYRKEIKSFFSNDKLFNYYTKYFDSYLKNLESVVWDYRWLFCRLAHRGLSVIPSRNQIKNIGFGIEATHTLNAESKLSNLPTNKLLFPLHLNETVIPDLNYDNRIYEEFLKPASGSKPGLKKKIVSRIKNFLE